MEKRIDAHVVRKALRQVHLPWIEGAQDPYAQAYLGKRMHSAKSTLMAFFDQLDFKNFSKAISIPTLAAETGYSGRNITRRVRGLEEIGLIERTPKGPGPWEVTLNVDLVLQAAEDHTRRRITERADAAARRYTDRKEKEQAEGQQARERWSRRRSEMRDPVNTDPSTRPADFDPEPAECTGQGEAINDDLAPMGGISVWEPPHPDPAPSTRAARRREARETPRVAPGRMASALWNLNPYRTSGTQMAGEADHWPTLVLSMEPTDLWGDVLFYCRTMHTGSHRWRPGAATPAGYRKYASAIRQVRVNPEMPEYGFGRMLRARELTSYPLPPLEPWELVRPRCQVLAPWLWDLVSEWCHDHHTLATWVGDLLDQSRGPPPDWLPEALHPRWGDLPLFNLP